MARLNISIPDDVYELAEAWRGKVNLSSICAEALRAELQSASDHRDATGLIAQLRGPSEIEQELALRFSLRAAVVAPTSDHDSTRREVLGSAAARYLERQLDYDSILSIGGGRQMWCVVRSLTPRRARVVVAALGYGQFDPEVLHAHSNTLATLVWLLYGPYSRAHLVGSSEFRSIWDRDPPVGEGKSRFLLASCGPFAPDSPLRRVLGDHMSARLDAENVAGDIAYQFYSRSGEPIPIDVRSSNSVLSDEQLRAQAEDGRSQVILVAAGDSKLEMLELALDRKVCNVLVTDGATARSLLGA